MLNETEINREKESSTVYQLNVSDALDAACNEPKYGNDVSSSEQQAMVNALCRLIAKGLRPNVLRKLWRSYWASQFLDRIHVRDPRLRRRYLDQIMQTIAQNTSSTEK